MSILSKMYIGGQWSESESNKTITVLNPADGSMLTTIPRGTEKDVDRAVKEARKAFESHVWKSFSPYKRGKILNEVAAKIRKNKDLLAGLETMDVGKPLSQAKNDVEVAARYFEFYAGISDKIMGETIPVEYGILDYTLREPVGITAHIIPWNYPIQIAARSVAAAIATGNAVVMKPAEDTPLTTLKLAELFADTELPKGLLHVVTGYGHEAGAALAAHPDVNHVTFTGSVKTGMKVMESAARNIVPVTLELGGKSPNIIFADCHMEEAVATVMKSIIQNAGQTCSAGSRLLVQNEIKEVFLSKLVNQMEKLTIGPGASDCDLGPVLNRKQFDRVMSFIDWAKVKGGKILTGGNRYIIPGMENGFYIQPTVIDEVTVNSCLTQDEIFGPVMTVYSFETEEEALELANGTSYGLVAGIWTNDLQRAHRMADKVKAGQVFINNYGAGGGIQMPFGGYKKKWFW